MDVPATMDPKLLALLASVGGAVVVKLADMLFGMLTRQRAEDRHASAVAAAVAERQALMKQLTDALSKQAESQAASITKASETTGLIVQGFAQKASAAAEADRRELLAKLDSVGNALTSIADRVERLGDSLGDLAQRVSHLESALGGSPASHPTPPRRKPR